MYDEKINLSLCFNKTKYYLLINFTNKYRTYELLVHMIRINKHLTDSVTHTYYYYQINLIYYSDLVLNKNFIITHENILLEYRHSLFNRCNLPATK